MPQSFWKRYKLNYPPAIDSNDVLVSRLSREFARRQLSLHDALKVRTVAHQLSAEKKRREISKGLAFVEDQRADVYLSANAHNYGNGLLTQCIGMARAGSRPLAGCPISEPRGSRQWNSSNAHWT